jgi:hypothetical protein
MLSVLQEKMLQFQRIPEKAKEIPVDMIEAGVDPVLDKFSACNLSFGSPSLSHYLSFLCCSDSYSFF